MNLTYKEEHELFVSDHAGTTVAEISVVCSTAPVGCLLRHVILNWLAGGKTYQLPTWLIFGVDFLTTIVTVMCAFTVLADNIEVLMILIIAMVVCLLMCTEKYCTEFNPNIKAKFTINGLLGKILPGKRPFLTNFRANVNVATAISILAVDFLIFPRRFCKAETYGSGLMDVGVGAFVLSNALVSPEARDKHDSSVKNFIKTVKGTFPLWVLGFIRLLSVKSIEYQEHTSEYGVHWNFFFTLAVVRVLASGVYVVFRRLVPLSWLLSIATIAFYHFLLDGSPSLRSFVLMGADSRGSRQGLLDANREGILSSLGYLAIYFAGVQLGRFLLRPRYFLRDYLWVLLQLYMAEMVTFALLYVSETHFDPVSRRLANFSYLLFTLQFNLLMLMLFLLAEILVVVFHECGILICDTKDSISNGPRFSLLAAINRNGLFYFLFANLLTGIVNLCVPTIHMSIIAGFTIVYVYLLILSCSATVLDIRNVTLRYW